MRPLFYLEAFDYGGGYCLESMVYIMRSDGTFGLLCSHYNLFLSSPCLLLLFTLLSSIRFIGQVLVHLYTFSIQVIPYLRPVFLLGANPFVVLSPLDRVLTAGLVSVRFGSFGAKAIDHANRFQSKAHVLTDTVQYGIAVTVLYNTVHLSCTLPL